MGPSKVTSLGQCHMVRKKYQPQRLSSQGPLQLLYYISLATGVDKVPLLEVMSG